MTDPVAVLEELAKFEAWARRQGFHPTDFERIEGRPTNDFGMNWEYNGNFLQAAWAAWMERAAIALMRAPVGDAVVWMTADGLRVLTVAAKELLAYGSHPETANLFCVPLAAMQQTTGGGE